MPLQKNLLHPLIFDPSQEVDRFQDLEEELALRGYNGVWKVGENISGLFLPISAVVFSSISLVLANETGARFGYLYYIYDEDVNVLKHWFQSCEYMIFNIP